MLHAIPRRLRSRSSSSWGGNGKFLPKSDLCCLLNFLSRITSRCRHENWIYNSTHFLIAFRDSNLIVFLLFMCGASFALESKLEFSFSSYFFTRSKIWDKKERLTVRQHFVSRCINISFGVELRLEIRIAQSTRKPFSSPNVCIWFENVRF